jgi:hypothetical protein
MIKTTIRLLIFFVFGTISCKNQQTETIKNESTINAKSEAKKLDDFLKKYEEPSQIFQISSDKPTKVNGKHGTSISINPDDLATESGEPLGKNISIELKELTNQNQLFKTNAQTVSNGKLLVSGGAYYINFTSDGQQLKLKDGKTFKVEFPKLSDNEMSLFYGQRDSLGRIDWKQTKETFEAKPDSIRKRGTGLTPQVGYSEMDALLGYMRDTASTPVTKEEKDKVERVNKIYKKLYAAVDLNSFGWINCDRFLEIQRKTDLLVNFNPKDSINYASIYLVFKDINSVMQSYYFSDNTKTSNEGFANIPIGYKVRLIAYSIKDEKILSFASDITITDKQKLTLTMKETSDDELRRLLKN